MNMDRHLEIVRTNILLYFMISNNYYWIPVFIPSFLIFNS